VAYDHRSFGDSEGEPRQELDPWLQVRDYRHAITYAETLKDVDPDRVGIWGTSYAGGHVLCRRCDRSTREVRRCTSSDDQRVGVDLAAHASTRSRRAAPCLRCGSEGAI
jgi:dienelactone hydrolase